MVKIIIIVKASTLLNEGGQQSVDYSDPKQVAWQWEKWGIRMKEEAWAAEAQNSGTASNPIIISPVVSPPPEIQSKADNLALMYELERLQNIGEFRKVLRQLMVMHRRIRGNIRILGEKRSQWFLLEPELQVKHHMKRLDLHMDINKERTHDSYWVRTFWDPDTETRSIRRESIFYPHYIRPLKRCGCCLKKNCWYIL